MTDVYNLIKPFLKFDNEDDFYYLQIIQRKKENPHLGSNSRVIKNYYIRNINYLEKHYNEIKTLCNVFNARAMLRLNKRSYRKVAFKALQNVANTMSNEEYKHISKAYDSACGKGHNDKEKKWIVDVDVNDSHVNEGELCNFINSCQPLDRNKIYTRLPTKNGYHLLTKPFNTKEFSGRYPKVEIHKDNPINLYIP